MKQDITSELLEAVKALAEARKGSHLAQATYDLTFDKFKKTHAKIIAARDAAKNLLKLMDETARELALKAYHATGMKRFPGLEIKVIESVEITDQVVLEKWMLKNAANLIRTVYDLEALQKGVLKGVFTDVPGIVVIQTPKAYIASDLEKSLEESTLG